MAHDRPAPPKALTLPSGAWVLLRDPEDLNAGDQEDLMKDLSRPNADKPFHFAYDLTTGLKLLMIEDWHIPYLPDPVALPIANPKQLRLLKISDNNVLENALLPARELLFPKRPDNSDAQLDDKSSPTMPASA